MKILYQFMASYGRQGTIESIFIAEEDDLADCLGKTIYFGEILGKHSDISYTLKQADFGILSEDQDFIKKCLEIFRNRTLSGINPLDYIEEEKEEIL